jgi:DNA-directed DNA polymerase III PolC
MFTHLHIHSAFSFLEGTFSIPQFLFQLEELGIKQIALTDTNGLYGAIHFYKFALQIGIKPILGCCLKTSDAEAVLLAKTKKGFGQICKVVTARNLSKDFSLTKYLIKITNPEFFVISKDESLLISLSEFWDKEHLYVELIRTQERNNENQIRTLQNLAKELQIGVVATNDVHFLYSQDHFVHRVFTAIQKQSHIHASDLILTSPECWLKTSEEMEKLFSDIPEAINNTQIIADECNVNLDIGSYTFPKFVSTNGNSPFQFLQKICYEGLQKRYGNPNEQQINRLQHELSVIRDLKFTEYFLVVWDILQFAKEKKIHWVGRGSAACSIVSYVLGITNVDPIRYDLFFERFLNPGRKTAPDIDLDFGWKQREEIVNYVYDRYGDDHVAMISTYVTFTARLAVREIGKAFGLPEEEITSISSRIPYGADATSILQDKTKFPETREMPIDREPYHTIFRLAAHINGHPRHLSLHPGGIVIAPHPITDLVPLERSAKGLVMTQYDMYGVEDIGLVKIDLLAQRSLSVVDDVLERLREEDRFPEVIYDYEALYKDEKVNDKIAKGETIGCFYVESPSMRGLLQKLRVRNFEDLTAASSVIRPGVAESGMMQQYIRRKTGEEPVDYLHPKMEIMLKETCGVMIYQEDVIRVAHEIAGMSLADADLLRRAMSGKERSPLAMAELEHDFLSKAASNNVDPKIAKEIWDKISTFAAYAFCKAHSASYAQLSYQVAFLKTYFPAEFMAAVLTNQGGFYSTMAYIEECRRMGLRILSPDVRNGNFIYSAEDPHTVRVGLMQIKGISEKSWETFLIEREKNLYCDFADFVLRSGFREGEIEILIKTGACDSFDMNRSQLMWFLKSIFPVANKNRLNQDLFGAKMISQPVIPRMREYTVEEKLAWEMQLMDIAITAHPLHLYKPWELVNNYIPAKNLHLYGNQNVRVIGWQVTTKPATTNKNEPMLFVSFEDTETIYETTFFPRAYQKFGHLFRNRGPYVIGGRVEEDHGVYTINVDYLEEVWAGLRPVPIK